VRSMMEEPPTGTELFMLARMYSSPVTVWRPGDGDKALAMLDDRTVLHSRVLRGLIEKGLVAEVDATLRITDEGTQALWRDPAMVRRVRLRTGARGLPRPSER